MPIRRGLSARRVGPAYRLYNELSPHQAVRAVLEQLLDRVLVLVAGHRAGLAAEANTEGQSDSLEPSQTCRIAAGTGPDT